MGNCCGCCLEDEFSVAIRKAQKDDDKRALLDLKDQRFAKRAAAFYPLGIISIVLVLGILTAIFILEIYYKNALGGTVALLVFSSWMARDYFGALRWPYDSVNTARIRIRSIGNVICALFAFVFIGYMTNLLVNWCNDPAYLATDPWAERTCSLYKPVVYGALGLASGLVAFIIAAMIIDEWIYPAAAELEIEKDKHLKRKILKFKGV